MTTTVPPNHQTAERAVLGSILHDTTLHADAATLITADDFYRPNHGHIYEAMSRLVARGEPIDTVTVTAELDAMGIDSVTGVELLELVAEVPHRNVEAWARLVATAATKRRMIAALHEALKVVYEPGPCEQAVDRVESLVYAAADQRRGNDSLLPASTFIPAAAHEILDRWDAADDPDAAPGAGTVGTPTGWIDLDAKLGGGLIGGKLYVVGARPGAGKSVLAVGMSTAVAKAGLPVLMFSLEMGHNELAQRMLAAEGRVDASLLKGGVGTQRDRDRLMKAAEAAAGWALDVDASPHVTLGEIRSRARRVAAKRGRLGLIVVDYLQLMRSTGRSENRQVEVAEIARGLKVLAREFDVPVVAPAQLNRGLEARVDKRPVASDLRETGELENAADVILGLYRDEMYNDATRDKGVCEVIILKQRDGPLGTVRLAFRPERVAFENLANSGHWAP